MIPLVPLTTAFAVLLHALLGCCMHHEHAGVTGMVPDPAATHEGRDCSDAPAIVDAASDHANEPAHGDGPLSLGHQRHTDDHDHDRRQPRRCKASDCSVVLSVSVASALGFDAHWTHVDDRAAAEATIRLAEAKRHPPRGEDSSPTRRLSRLCIWLI